MEKEALEKVSDFALGEENLAFAPYFIGKSYLSLLNDKEVGIYNVTFELPIIFIIAVCAKRWGFIMSPLNQGVATIGTSIMAQARS
jgi:hypothetical protein